MARDDSSLNTGMSSALERKRRATAIEQKKRTDQTKAVVAPALEPVLELLDDMKAEVTNVKNVLFDGTITEDDKLKKMERMKADYELLSRVETRMKQLFRSTEKTDE